MAFGSDKMDDIETYRALLKPAAVVFLVQVPLVISIAWFLDRKGGRGRGRIRWRRVALMALLCVSLCAPVMVAGIVLTAANEALGEMLVLLPIVGIPLLVWAVRGCKKTDEATEQPAAQ